MNKKYRETFSALRPSDEAVERVMNMANNNINKNTKRILTPVVAVACCLAVVVTTVVGTGAFKGRESIAPEQVTNSSSASSIEAPGFAFVAYAGERESSSDEHSWSAKVPMKSKIGAIDIRGKSQKEIDEIVAELYKKYDLAIWDFPSFEEDNKNVLTALDVNDTAYDNAVIYQFRNGFFDLDLGSDFKDEIKEIRVKNKNKGASFMMTSLSIYYDENGEVKDEYGMYAKGIHKDSISGEEYKRDLELQEKHGKRMFGIEWSIDIPIFTELNKNPDYDLTQIKDSLTIEVEFKDGSVSKSKIDLSFDKEGYMFAEPKGFDYISAK